MQVILSKHLGFCAGVKKAVDTALSVPPENTYVLGELIHNREVNDLIRRRGIPIVSRLEDIPDGATVLIRSHGVGKECFRQCRDRNIAVRDCTCPFVGKTQKIIEEQSRLGKTVVIIGHKDHPEVQGLIGWASGKVYVFLRKPMIFRFYGIKKSLWWLKQRFPSKFFPNL